MASAPTGISRANTTVLGVVIIARHGDRQGFYQNAINYMPSNTAITPLGNVQEFQLGQQLRSIYLTPGSPSFIANISRDVVQDAQVQVRADGGGERGVIFNSAVSLLQGLFPATQNYSTTLANGTTVVGALGGYQTVPIESVETDNDVSLEGWIDCNTFINATAAFYASDGFKAKATANAQFFTELAPFLSQGTGPVNLQNMWNIFDYMNVQSIHNATFANALPPTFLEHARDLANYHEWGVFSGPQPTDIRNIAGQTILPSILDGITGFPNTTNPKKMVYEAVSYKPFIGLFQLLGAADINPQLQGVVNYASVLSLEVRQPASGSGEPVIRFQFKNGTDDVFQTYNFLNSTDDVPVSTFVNALQPLAFDDLPTWCKVCANTQDRGCQNLAIQPSQTPMMAKQAISPIGAGFLGAGLTLAVAIILLIVLSFLKILTFGKQNRRIHSSGNETDSMERKL